jgi:1-hydroxycarotenoid 3,4-desaturase
MHELAQALAAPGASARRHAALRATCERIELARRPRQRRVLAGGERLPADAVVFNGDPQALVQGLLGPTRCGAVPAGAARLKQRSLSALTWAVHAPTERASARAPQRLLRRRLPSASSTTSSAAAACPARHGLRLRAGPHDDAGRRAGRPSGCCAWSTHPPTATAPLRPHGDRPMRDEPGPAAPLRPAAGAGAAQVQCTTPADFERLFPATGGALYGRRRTAGWPRSAGRGRQPVPGLYLAGGSVHPGPGVPMAAMSGRLAAAALMAHLASTSRSRRVAISGGTSTRSATTAATP